MAQLIAISHTSLMHGWVPLAVQVVTAIVLATALGWRSRHWRLVRLPLAALAGGAVAYGTHWFFVNRGLSNEPAPTALWLWIALAGMAAAASVRIARARSGNAPAPKGNSNPKDRTPTAAGDVRSRPIKCSFPGHRQIRCKPALASAGYDVSKPGSVWRRRSCPRPRAWARRYWPATDRSFDCPPSRLLRGTRGTIA